MYLVTDEGGLSRDFGLRDQMRRAAVSIMSNIAEGHDRQGQNEFIHFLSMAAGSCAELRSQLYVAQDVGYLDSAMFADLNQCCVEVSRILTGLMASLKRSRSRGENTTP